jgi:hypothetical protein
LNDDIDDTKDDIDVHISGWTTTQLAGIMMMMATSTQLPKGLRPWQQRWHRIQH